MAWLREIGSKSVSLTPKAWDLVSMDMVTTTKSNLCSIIGQAKSGRLRPGDLKQENFKLFRLHCKLQKWSRLTRGARLQEFPNKWFDRKRSLCLFVCCDGVMVGSHKSTFSPQSLTNLSSRAKCWFVRWYVRDGAKAGLPLQFSQSLNLSCRAKRMAERPSVYRKAR